MYQISGLCIYALSATREEKHNWDFYIPAVTYSKDENMYIHVYLISINNENLDCGSDDNVSQPNGV